MRLLIRTHITFLEISIFIAITISSTFNYAFSQNDSMVISSFRPIIESFKEYYSTSPYFLEEQSYSNSPSSFIYFLHRYVFVKVVDNIERTNSLTTPFVASLVVSANDYINTQNGGNFIDERTNRSYYSLVQSCINDTSFALSRSLTGTLFPPNHTRYTFNYHNGKWILSSYEDIFLQRGLHLPYNNHWVVFFKNFSE